MTGSGTRPPATGDPEFVVELIGWEGLCGHRAAWKDLSARAVEPNIFYDPAFAIPAAAALGASEKLSAVLVWREDEAGAGSGSRTLAGLFPFLERRRWGVPIAVGEAFIHPYAMSSAPLVDAVAADDVLRAFLDWLNMARHAPAAWLFRFLPGDGRLHEGLCTLAERLDMTSRAYSAHERAVLDAGELDANYLRNALSGKSRKEYGRLRRRLAGHGPVSITRATTPTEIETTMAEFLALEASGWKGRRGTAAANSTNIAGMFEEIGRGLSAGREIRIDALRVGDRAISMTVSCGRADHWWLWKIAYDEEFATFSPGVLLVLALTEAALSAGTGEHYDSCSLPGHPMIERIWRQRRPYVDMLLVPARRGKTRRIVVRLESLRRAGEQRARALRRLVSGI